MIEMIRDWSEMNSLLRQLTTARFRLTAYARVMLMFLRGAVLAFGGVALLIGTNVVQILYALLLVSRTGSVFRRIGSGLADFREAERLGVAQGTINPTPVASWGERAAAAVAVTLGVWLPAAVLIVYALR